MLTLVGLLQGWILSPRATRLRVSCPKRGQAETRSLETCASAWHVSADWLSSSEEGKWLWAKVERGEVRRHKG